MAYCRAWVRMGRQRKATESFFPAGSSATAGSAHMRMTQHFTLVDDDARIAAQAEMQAAMAGLSSIHTLVAAMSATQDKPAGGVALLVAAQSAPGHRGKGYPGQ